jgi:hypothetical protein
VISTNLKLVRQSLDKMESNIGQGAENLATEAMSILIQLSKEQIKGKRGKTDGVWDKATAGQPPMNRTGNLRRSIRGQKRKVGFAKYEVIVGPTMVYGRAVELGAEYAPPSWRGTTAMKGFPFMAPAFKQFQPMLPQLVRKHLSVGGK